MVAGADDRHMLRGALQTLRAQTSPWWSLIIGSVQRPSGVFGHSMSRRPWALPEARRPGGSGPKIRWRSFAEGTSTSEVLGALFEEVRSDAVALLDPADRLEPDAVDLLSASLRTADLVYADEDEIDPDGGLWRPRLKPGWSPDLLLATPYLGHPMAVRTAVVRASGALGPTACDDPEHDLMLRATEQTSRIVHLPEVLCHRASPDLRSRPQRDRPGLARRGVARHDLGLSGGEPGGGEPGGGVVREALLRRGEEAAVEPGPLPRTYRIRRTPPMGTQVTAIVPFRDQPRLLRACVDSISATTSGDIDLQVLLVDNGSTDPETLSLVERLGRRPEVTVLGDPRPFNWAAINNSAARTSTAEVLLFLNNDIEALEPGWLEALVAQALRPDIGAVGARLLYPDRRVQHVGMVVGLGGAAGHVLVGLGAGEPGYLAQAVLAHECSAVTGACLATRRSVFDALGGFDEELGLDLNDVDYCLRAGNRDLRVIIEPAARLIHHESPSRGTSGSVPDILRFIDRWEQLLVEGDPYLNPNLTRADASCALARPDEKERWMQWRSTLETS
jgi:GT2 family glycosyltransferase